MRFAGCDRPPLSNAAPTFHITAWMAAERVILRIHCTQSCSRIAIVGAACDIYLPIIAFCWLLFLFLVLVAFSLVTQLRIPLSFYHAVVDFVCFLMALLHVDVFHDIVFCFHFADHRSILIRKPSKTANAGLRRFISFPVPVRNLQNWPISWYVSAVSGHG